MKYKFALGLICSVAWSYAAQAAYVVDVAQVGSDVIATGSGSINLDGLQYDSTLQVVSDINGLQTELFLGAFEQDEIVNLYDGATGPDSIGPLHFHTGADSSFGAQVGITCAGRDDCSPVVPDGYISQTPLGVSTAIFSNFKYRTLGITPGSYVYSFGSGANADTFTINILGSSATPEPATWAMMIVGFGMVGSTLRRHGKARPTVRFA